jgi:hypothetical protein
MTRPTAEAGDAIKATRAMAVSTTAQRVRIILDDLL